MAIHASFQGLGSLGYQKYGQVAPGAVNKGVLPECVSAAKALLASGKAGVLPSQCYADALAGPLCGGSCREELKRVAAGSKARMVQRSGPAGDTTCLKNAMSMQTVVCKNGKPVSTNTPGAAMDAATADASEQGAGQGWTEDTNYQPDAEEGSPWPLRIGIGAGVGLLVAGALYMKYGRG